MTGDPVYVKLTRPEGYEDVCEQIVIEDAEIHPAFMPEPATDEIEHLRDQAEAYRQRAEAAEADMAEQDREIERLRTALRPFVEAYERCGRRESWAASYLNNNAWKAAAEALPTKDSQCHGEPGVDCPVHPMTEENQKPVNHIECRHCGAGCRFGGVLRHEPGCPALEKISG